MSAFLISNQAFGQTTANESVISGYVYDYDTKEPISNASLELANLTSIKSITDINGRYNFLINCSSYLYSAVSYNISCIATEYNPIKITKTINKNDNTRTIDFYLKRINKCPDTLSDGFDQENATLWLKSNWVNSDPFFLNAWKPDFNHIRTENGSLTLTLGNQPCVNNKSDCQNKSFASGECRTICSQYKYGELEARIVAGKGNGVVTGIFFLGGMPGTQDEIDVEIFGKDAVKSGQWEIQTNYFSNGDQGNRQDSNGIQEPSHAAIVPLSFDPSLSYHIYKISWIGEGKNCTEIKWYVDNKLRRDVWRDNTGDIQSNVFNDSGNIIATGSKYKGSLPTSGSQIFLNLWAAINWPDAGIFNYYSEKLIQARIDWIRYSSYNNG